MFVLSVIHDWQDDPAVKQVLLFPNQEVKDSFYLKFNKLVEDQGIEEASDSGLGVIFKIRAVMNSDKTYTPVIRCGNTGKLIWESNRREPIPEIAIRICFHECIKSLKERFLEIKLS